MTDSTQILAVVNGLKWKFTLTKDFRDGYSYQSSEFNVMVVFSENIIVFILTYYPNTKQYCQQFDDEDDAIQFILNKIHYILSLPLMVQ